MCTKAILVLLWERMQDLAVQASPLLPKPSEKRRVSNRIPFFNDAYLILIQRVFEPLAVPSLFIIVSRWIKNAHGQTFSAMNTVFANYWDWKAKRAYTECNVITNITSTASCTHARLHNTVHIIHIHYGPLYIKI